MRQASHALRSIDAMITDAAGRGLLWNRASDDILTGRTVRISGDDRRNFGSCSYLGLELDDRIKAGVIDAVTRFGSQFSSSRTYLSAPAYSVLELLLSDLFERPLVITPSTSMGHIAALPVLVGERDAVLMDQEVHHSVQTAIQLVRSLGVPIEIIRHGRLDRLADRIKDLSLTHDKVWFLADGVYSMSGALAPLDSFRRLLADFPKLHLYIDDAHGMSWRGSHGRGHAADGLGDHDRVIIAASLNKAFSAAGGVILLPDAEIARKVRVCGGPLIFSGPIQPPMLGAAIASARIHLSDEMPRMQDELLERIRLCTRLFEERGIPLASTDETPIRFVPLGLPIKAYEMVGRLMEDGFYTNCGMFPAVPMKRSGVRFTLTRHQTLDDIEALADAIARHLPLVREDVAPKVAFTLHERKAGLRLLHDSTIAAIDFASWDEHLGSRGSFSWEGLRMLEQAFGEGEKPEDTWRFHYYRVLDETGRVVAQTFFTEALWKDDLTTDQAVSRAVERVRERDPYYLTTLQFGMGSPLTEGDHVYLDRTGPWQEALRMVIKAAGDHQRECGAPVLVVRDLPADDPEMDAFMLELGLSRMLVPESLVLEVDHREFDAIVLDMPKAFRRHQRKEVLPFRTSVEVRVIRDGLAEPLAHHFHRLYRNVKERNIQLNTFALPQAVFGAIGRSPAYEIICLHVPGEDLPVAMLAGFKGPEQFVPLIVGLDYRYLASHGLYRQCLLQAILRAQAHGSRRVCFGIGASLEKRRFGAKAESRCAYVQASDHYGHEVLANLEASVAIAR